MSTRLLFTISVQFVHNKNDLYLMSTRPLCQSETGNQLQKQLPTITFIHLPARKVNVLVAEEEPQSCSNQTEPTGEGSIQDHVLEKARC